MVLCIILAILIVILSFVLSSLFFWGIGCLVINVFGITYTWTFLHGLCTAIIVWILNSIFGEKK